MEGDALEDPITYVAEPARLESHLADLRRMVDWNVARILPNHGDASRIEAGGYGPGLIAATIRYIEWLLRSRTDRALRALDLRDFWPMNWRAATSTTLPPTRPYTAVISRCSCAPNRRHSCGLVTRGASVAATASSTKCGDEPGRWTSHGSQHIAARRRTAFGR